MTNAYEPDGELIEVDGKPAARFERRYAHPLERVWDAITRPEELAKWFLPFPAAEIELDLEPGGRFELRWGGPEPGSMSSTVLRVEVPTLFEFTHVDEGSSLRWELEPDGEDGCRLTVTHLGLIPEIAAERHYLAGMHTSLEALASLLDGDPQAWSWERFEEHRDRYADRRSA